LYGPSLRHTIDLLGIDQAKDFLVRSHGMSRFRDGICMFIDDGLRRIILDESHTSNLSLHPSITKMY